MKELIAVILLLMIFSSARGEAPVEYFNKGEEVVDAEVSTESGNTLTVGVDLQEGLYTFIAGSECQGTMTVTNWDGSETDRMEVYPGWVETLTVYNEQTVRLPEGVSYSYNLTFGTKTHDTGTRQLRIREAGVYTAGKNLAAGLYIVQNEGLTAADVSIIGRDGETRHSWSLANDAHYTIWLDEGEHVEIGVGILLRSMTTQWLFQEGTRATVAQSRFSTQMQIPGRAYTLIGRDYTSCVCITNLEDGSTARYPLERGQELTLNTRDMHDEEWLIEMVNVDVCWEQGEG